MKIEFSIPESYAAEVQDGTPILFRMEKDGMMQNYKATVYAVESKVDMATRTLKVRATYPNPGENILPGRYTSVEISKREIKDALAIPSEAVIPEMGKDIVYLYKNGRASRDHDRYSNREPCTGIARVECGRYADHVRRDAVTYRHESFY